MTLMSSRTGVSCAKNVTSDDNDVMVIDANQFDNDDAMCIDGQNALTKSGPTITVPESKYAEPGHPLSANWSTAMYNKSRVRAFLHSFHWDQIAEAETGLYAGVLYVLCDNYGSFEAISSRRVKPKSTEFCCLRVVLLGPKAMFLDSYAPRYFFFDFVPASKRSLTPMQANSITLTARLLNARAQWMQHGLRRWSDREVPGQHGDSPAGTPTSPLPYIPMVPTALGGKSPPGQERKHEIYQPIGTSEHPGGNQPQSPEQKEAQIERVAMANLKKLGDANIPQTSATLFLDCKGVIRVILYARPTSDSLGFVNEEDECYHVVRVEMSEGTVSIEHPFGEPNEVQAGVARMMESVLRDACRTHAARYQQQQQQQSPRASG